MALYDNCENHFELTITGPLHCTDCLRLFLQNWPNPISPLKYLEEKLWRVSHPFVQKILSMFLCILKTERCRKVIKLILCSSKKAELRSIRESYSKADFSSLLKQINYCCCLQNRTDSEGMISMSVKMIRHYMNGCWQRDICTDRNFEKMTPLNLPALRFMKYLP